MAWFVFFFSSRRRHTRCGRDWSSDVCSSDLAIILNNLAMLSREQGEYAQALLLFQRAFTIVEEAFGPDHPTAETIRKNRSEERRVGKECRSRWWRYQSTKNKETPIL